VSIDGPAHLERVGHEETLALRQRVLRPHLNPRDVVFPGDDAAESGHFVMKLADGTVVATGSVLPEESPWGEPGWRLRGMATEESLRGQGLGTQVLLAALDHVRAHGGGLLWFNARVRALPFYHRAGFQTRGEPWEVPLIGPHIVMWRRV
jgi:GNAT superfamily N-acetyltransferase